MDYNILYDHEEIELPYWAIHKVDRLNDHVLVHLDWYMWAIDKLHQVTFNHLEVKIKVMDNHSCLLIHS